MAGDQRVFDRIIESREIFLSTIVIVESGAKLITFDPHFRRVAGVRVWDPAEG